MQLSDLYRPDGPERVGFVLKDGTVVEVTNVCSEPEEGFEVSAEDLVTYSSDAVATWHTHPGASRNLSIKDYEMFLDWSDLDHYIIGDDGVRRYTVMDGDVYHG